ncbi:TrmH family RNA methyltransferase [Lacinutrix venerupis]|uniref:TrmH family RNA methyltransferase n=1 Tax=Lacinutrix venerupis TaxID=1486034 RepID=UPI000EAE00AC|nr:RNA methyltransferase [Lacinutrix venerupis]RLJ67408.1 TrmH family RNA methyltransferase [Lacinutrix venerupis]
MLSKSQIKLITRLKQKKYRIADGFFVAEGIKVINELLNSSLQLHYLFTTESFVDNNEQEILITENELKKISFLTTPNKALAVFKIPEQKNIETKGLIVALDSVRDPGNLGTIIRLCDWFGVKELICSKETVDCYNPKVVQATMGSITRVNISYLDLNMFLAETKIPIFGAFMDGENVYKKQLPKEGIIVLGNEANGISKNIEKQVTERIAIPRFGDLQETESLNVATAGSILLSEFRRS